MAVDCGYTGDDVADGGAAQGGVEVGLNFLFTFHKV